MRYQVCDCYRYYDCHTNADCITLCGTTADLAFRALYAFLFLSLFIIFLVRVLLLQLCAYFFIVLKDIEKIHSKLKNIDFFLFSFRKKKCIFKLWKLNRKSFDQTLLRSWIESLFYQTNLKWETNALLEILFTMLSTNNVSIIINESLSILR